MTLRNLAENTKKSYMRSIEGLARFYRLSPDRLTNDEMQKYLLYRIREEKRDWSTINVDFSAYRCFYRELLGWEETRFHIPPRPKYKKLPMVMTLEEVLAIVDATPNLKHRALLTTTYSGGLRVKEVVRLRPDHIESKRMLIRVEQGKGRKDRYKILAQTTLAMLKDYRRAYRPGEWLFFGRDKTEHMPSRTAQKIYQNAKKASGITKGRGIHTLRHCFATHHLERGTDIYTIKKMMGHKSLETTLKYLHVADTSICRIKSSMDEINENRAMGGKK